MINREYVECRVRADRGGENSSFVSLKRRLVRECGNVCCRCKGVFHYQYLELDHAIPLALGGLDRDEDFQVICCACHTRKTFIDIKIIAAARNLNFVHDGRLWAGRAFLKEFYLQMSDAAESTTAAILSDQHCFYNGKPRPCWVRGCGAHILAGWTFTAYSGNIAAGAPFLTLNSRESSKERRRADGGVS